MECNLFAHSPKRIAVDAIEKKIIDGISGEKRHQNDGPEPHKRLALSALASSYQLKFESAFPVALLADQCCTASTLSSANLLWSETSVYTVTPSEMSKSVGLETSHRKIALIDKMIAELERINANWDRGKVEQERQASKVRYCLSALRRRK